MSFQNKLAQIKETLTGIEGLEVGHYEYSGTADRYCVWAEDTESSSVESDNYKTEQAIQGTIDLYTKTEFDPYVDAVQDAMKTARISFYLNSVQYEDETELIHYEWVFDL